MSTEETRQYRGFTLVAQHGPTGAKCWAWRDGKPMHKLEGVDVPAAMQAARQAIDEALGVAARDGDAGEQAYTRALQAIVAKLTPSQIRMLQAHYRAPDRVITVAQLAQAAQYPNFRPANLHYGNIGKALHEHHPVVLRTRKNGSLIYTLALADDIDGNLSQADDDSGFRWRMLPSLAFALRAVGLVSD